MSDEPDRQDLEDRVDQLESTISKMLPSRRDALKLGGAALVGGAAMSGSASAGTQQAGTIGTSGSPVDVESEDINNADTVTTQDLVVNGTATGPFGGAPVLESGDSIEVHVIDRNTTSKTFVTLYSGGAKDVLCGTITSRSDNDFLYTFSDSTKLRKNGGGGTSYRTGGKSIFRDSTGTEAETDVLPPAKDVTKIEIGGNTGAGEEFGAEVILKG